MKLFRSLRVRAAIKRRLRMIQPAQPAKLEDLKAFVDRFRGRVNPKTIDRECAQFLAMLACLRMPLP